MRFWQKIFISLLPVFIIIFDTGVFFVASCAFRFTLDGETESALREQEIILSSVRESISIADSLFPGAARNHTRLAAVVRPLAEYYSGQGIVLWLYDERTPVFSGGNEVSTSLIEPESKQDKTVMQESPNGVRHLFISSHISDFPYLTFVYARNIGHIDDFRRDIIRIFLLLNIAVCAALCVSVYVILRHITRPIAQLSEIAAEIAGGAYDKRVHIKNKDETGELAVSFNLMADAVERNIDDLKKAAEQRQEFINNLSHEMRTPLTSVIGYSEYLQNAGADERRRIIAAGNLNMAACQLAGLSQTLMELSFLSGGDTEREPVNVGVLLDELEAIMSHTLRERGITLKTRTPTPGESPLSVQGDKTLLLSLLTNLTENAARASSEGQEITVTGTSAGEHTVLTVSDDGCGMAQEEIEKITQPFYRADKSRSRGAGGAGLGLALCEKIVELHGAALDIRSAPGQGTSVSVTFPK